MSGTWLILFVALWAVCIALVTLVVGLSHRIQSLESNVLVRGAVDTRAKATAQVQEQFVGRRVAEKAVESGIVGAAGGMAGVVLFVSEHCGPCQMLASDVVAGLETHQRKGLAEVLGARVTVITDQAGAFHELGASAVIVDSDGAVMNGFAVTATPTGIALDDEGDVIEALVPSSFSDVQELALAVQPRRRLGLSASR